MGKAEKTPVLSFNAIHLFRTVQEIIPIKLNFYTLYELKIKMIQSDNEKNCESNAVERVISPYTIKRRPPNTVAVSLGRYIVSSLVCSPLFSELMEQSLIS